MRPVLLTMLVFAAGCATPQSPAGDPADRFFDALAGHCGKAYEGRLVSNDPQDADFASRHLVMHVRECAGDVLRIPFHVGEDRSRTWVVTRTDGGLRLKHDHRHEDGSEDAITQYGGDSANVTATRAEFPADDYSIALFEREGLAVSVTNVWALEITDEIFAYELSRENRFFRIEFSVTEPVDAPPPPWGAE